MTGSDQGRSRIYAKRNGQLAGADMLRSDIEHLAHVLAFASHDGQTDQGLPDRPFNHPTLEERLETALFDIVQ